MKRLLRYYVSVFCLLALYSSYAAATPQALTVAFRADNSNGCTDLQVSFHDETVVPAGDAIVEWTWIFGDGTSSNEQHPQHIYTTGGAYNVKLIVKTGSGLIDSLTKAGIVNVFQGPVRPFGKDTAICQGSSFLLSAENPGATYTWNTGETSSSILVADEDEYSVVIELNGCEIKDTINVSIRPDVFPNFGFTINSTCTTFNVNFRDSSTTCNGNPLIKWKWEFGDGSTSSDQHPTHSYTGPGTYSVKLTVWDEFNFTISRTKSVVVVDGNIDVDLGNDTSFCAGSAVVLKTGITGAQYEWSTGETTQSISVNSAGTYWVKVTDNGCVGSDTVVVTSVAAMNVAFDYTQTVNCLPARVDFSDKSATCSSPITQWAWDFGDGNTSSNKNPQHNYLAAGNYFVGLTITTSDGTTLSAVQEITVTGSAMPHVDLPVDTSVCEGSPVELKVQESGAVYSWSTGETTQSIFVEDEGIYSVTVSKGGCSASDSVELYFKPQIFPHFGATAVADCENLKMQFTDSSTTCDVTITKWQWDLGDGNTSLAQNPLHTYAAPGSYVVKLKITDNTGYSLTRSKTVKVASYRPVVNLGADTAICYNSNFYLPAGIDADAYLWSTGETTPSILVNDEDQYWVEVTKNGCTSRDTINIAVKFQVIPDFDYDITSKCLPVRVAFTDKTELTCGESIIKWQWSFGDGDTASYKRNPTRDFVRSDSFVVRLTVTTQSGIVISRTKKIFIENTPFELTKQTDKNICKGNSIQLDAGVDGVEYSWSPAFALNSTTVRNPLASPFETTTYTVEATKCMITRRDTVVITVDSISRPVVKQDGNTLIAPSAVSYKWYKNGVKIDGKTSKTMNPSGAGYYNVEITNDAGCSNMSEAIYFLPQGENDKELGGVRVRLSPNPTHGLMKILLSKTPTGAVSYLIFNSYGNKVKGGTISNHVNQIDLQKLSKGTYFVQVFTATEKVVIPITIL